MGVPCGVLGSPHGINPCISLPHPITFPPNKPLVLKFLFQSASIDPSFRAQAGLRGSAPWPSLSITDLAVASAQGMSGHSLSSPMEPESWAQFLLQVTYPTGNLPPPGAPGRKKMPPESKLRCQHLRPGDPKGILGLPALSLLPTDPYPHQSPHGCSQPEARSYHQASRICPCHSTLHLAQSLPTRY